MLCHFQRLSLTALVANPLVLPVQPAVMILSGLAVLFGMVWLLLGQLVAYLAWPFAAQRVRKVASAVTHSLALAGLGALTILVWQQALAAPDGRLT